MASSPNAESEALNSLYKTGDMEQDGEEAHFNPYNPENVEITEADVRTILARFGLPPRLSTTLSFTAGHSFIGVMSNVLS